MERQQPMFMSKYDIFCLYFVSTPIVESLALSEFHSFCCPCSVSCFSNIFSSSTLLLSVVGGSKNPGEAFAGCFRGCRRKK